MMFLVIDQPFQEGTSLGAYSHLYFCRYAVGDSLRYSPGGRTGVFSGGVSIWGVISKDSLRVFSEGVQIGGCCH